MAQRLIRDDMLDSERVQTLPVDARWLYVSLLLTADDLGLLEVANFKLARRAGIDQKSIPVLTQLLADADLVRLYQADGKTYGFLPRFRQRLQIKRLRHPMPPLALLADDEDALKKINDLTANPRLESSGQPESTVIQPPEPELELEPEEEKPIEPSVLSGNFVPGPRSAGGYRVPECPYGEIVDLYHELLPAAPRVVVRSKGREALIRARWAQVCGEERWGKAEGLEFFADFFTGVASSKFLTGRVSTRDRTPFVADLEWLMKPSNFTKTLEGRYAQT